MITNRKFLAACVAGVLAFLASTFVATPWDIASMVVAALCGAAAVLLFLADRSQLDDTRRS
jgi:ABC-type thiamin/hydroxymethylpyrimidine transport system permease subunit